MPTCYETMDDAALAERCVFYTEPFDGRGHVY